MPDPSGTDPSGVDPSAADTLVTEYEVVGPWSLATSASFWEGVRARRPPALGSIRIPAPRA